MVHFTHSLHNIVLYDDTTYFTYDLNQNSLHRQSSPFCCRMPRITSITSDRQGPSIEGHRSTHSYHMFTQPAHTLQRRQPRSTDYRKPYEATPLSSIPAGPRPSVVANRCTYPGANFQPEPHEHGTPAHIHRPSVRGAKIPNPGGAPTRTQTRIRDDGRRRETSRRRRVGPPRSLRRGRAETPPTKWRRHRRRRRRRNVIPAANRHALRVRSFFFLFSASVARRRDATGRRSDSGGSVDNNNINKKKNGDRRERARVPRSARCESIRGSQGVRMQRKSTRKNDHTNSSGTDKRSKT